MAALQKKRGIGVLLISHDLAVVADIADEIVVMQEGRVVEAGNRDNIFRNARHPYTQKLLLAIPRGGKPENLAAIRPADHSAQPVHLVPAGQGAGESGG